VFSAKCRRRGDKIGPKRVRYRRKHRVSCLRAWRGCIDGDEGVVMPHGRTADGDDFASTDEVKVYKDEGEDEKRSSENLSEEKFGLVTETEEV